MFSINGSLWLVKRQGLRKSADSIAPGPLRSVFELNRKVLHLRRGFPFDQSDFLTFPQHDCLSLFSTPLSPNLGALLSRETYAPFRERWTDCKFLRVLLPVCEGDHRDYSSRSVFTSRPPTFKLFSLWIYGQVGVIINPHSIRLNWSTDHYPFLDFALPFFKIGEWFKRVGHERTSSLSWLPPVGAGQNPTANKHPQFMYVLWIQTSSLMFDYLTCKLMAINAAVTSVSCFFFPFTFCDNIFVHPQTCMDDLCILYSQLFHIYWSAISTINRKSYRTFCKIFD